MISPGNAGDGSLKRREKWKFRSIKSRRVFIWRVESFRLVQTWIVAIVVGHEHVMRFPAKESKELLNFLLRKCATFIVAALVEQKSAVLCQQV